MFLSPECKVSLRIEFKSEISPVYSDWRSKIFLTMWDKRHYYILKCHLKSMQIINIYNGNNISTTSQWYGLIIWLWVLKRTFFHDSSQARMKTFPTIIYNTNINVPCCCSVLRLGRNYTDISVTFINSMLVWHEAFSEFNRIAGGMRWG